MQNEHEPMTIKAKWYHFQFFYQSPASTKVKPDRIQKLFLSDSVNAKGTQTYSSVSFAGLDGEFEHLMTEHY